MLTALTAGLLLITISELGDKTFFIAVLMSMRYPRRFVFIGAFGALTAMTILSVAMGKVIALLPRIYTHYATIALFVFFGIKLLYDASKMSVKTAGEVVEEAKNAINSSEKQQRKRNNAQALVLKTFVMTFLAEWGDRTQIATVSLAASQNAVGVTIGSTIGHAICTLIAVLGGKLIAGRISERMVTAIGGVLFLIFAVVAVFEPV